MKDYVCNFCGYIGDPVGKLKGNIFVEFLLLLCLLIPGLLYSGWRSSGKQICPKCGHKMISEDFP